MLPPLLRLFELCFVWWLPRVVRRLLLCQDLRDRVATWKPTEERVATDTRSRLFKWVVFYSEACSGRAIVLRPFIYKTVEPVGNREYATADKGTIRHTPPGKRQ